MYFQYGFLSAFCPHPNPSKGWDKRKKTALAVFLNVRFNSEFSAGDQNSPPKSPFFLYASVENPLKW